MIQPQNIKVLIAEDEQDLREILASRFHVFGFQVLEASGGNEAFDLYEKNKPIDIVVTDIRMPGGSGLDLLKRLKQKDPSTPKVFLASAAENISKQELFNLGAEGFLEKPYDTRVLIDMVRKSLLSNKERWQMPPNFNIDHCLEEKFDSLQSAQASSNLGIGRGGVFLKTRKLLPDLEQHIALRIEATPLTISGVAKIKWKQQENHDTAWVGLEFVHINGPHAQDVYKWIEDNRPVAYLPTP